MLTPAQMIDTQTGSTIGLAAVIAVTVLWPHTEILTLLDVCWPSTARLMSMVTMVVGSVLIPAVAIYPSEIPSPKCVYLTARTDTGEITIQIYA